MTLTVTATPTANPSAFPKGFPKTVAVSKIPSHMRGEANGAAQAIAIAPGVWTALAPGASVLESATYGTRFGYCASIRAYESKFTVEEVGNSCW
ncbi:hypothetical protein GCM10027039_38350 [Terrabacter koreensis]